MKIEILEPSSIGAAIDETMNSVGDWGLADYLTDIPEFMSAISAMTTVMIINLIGVKDMAGIETFLRATTAMHIAFGIAVGTKLSEKELAKTVN